MKKKNLILWMLIVLFSTMIVECTNDRSNMGAVEVQVTNGKAEQNTVIYDTMWCVKVITEEGGANLRNRPNGDLIRTLHIGDTLKLLNETVIVNNQVAPWIQVALLPEDTIIGFLHNSYIDLDKKWNTIIAKDTLQCAESQKDDNKQLADTINKSAEDSAMHYILWQEKLVGVIVIKDTSFAKFNDDSLSVPGIAQKLNSAMVRQLCEKKQLEQTTQFGWWVLIIGGLGLLLGIIITYVFIKAVRRKRKGKSESQKVVLEAIEATSQEKKDSFMKEFVITK